MRTKIVGDMILAWLPIWAAHDPVSLRAVIHLHHIPVSTCATREQDSGRPSNIMGLLAGGPENAGGVAVVVGGLEEAVDAWGADTGTHALIRCAR